MRSCESRRPGVESLRRGLLRSDLSDRPMTTGLREESIGAARLTSPPLMPAAPIELQQCSLYIEWRQGLRSRYREQSRGLQPRSARADEPARSGSPASAARRSLGIDFRPSAIAPATARCHRQALRYHQDQDLRDRSRHGLRLQRPEPDRAAGRWRRSAPVSTRRWTGCAVTAISAQNVRLSVDNGLATQDTALAYAVGDPGFGTAPSIGGTAYTNSDNDPATGTVLYAIDARRDALVSVALAEWWAADHGRDGLRVRTSNMIGFDIPGAVQGTVRFGYAEPHQSQTVGSTSGTRVAAGRADRRYMRSTSATGARATHRRCRPPVPRWSASRLAP